MDRDEATALADRLLDAQVAHHLELLAGPDGAQLVVDDLLLVIGALDDVRVGEVLDGAALSATVTEGMDAVGGSPAIRALVTTMVRELHGLPASGDHPLGEVVPREHVEAIVAGLTASSGLRDAVLARLSDSPTMAALSMRFVSALVGDAVQQNRERAERIPGMKSVLGVGDFAARQARGLAPRQLEEAIGGAADKGTQAAMERVVRAVRDAFDQEAVATAAMELWDLHAAEPISGLESYLTEDELAGLAEHGHAIWLDARDAPWVQVVADVAVGAFLERYGDATVGELRAELALDDAFLTTQLERHVPAALDALVRTGVLEALLRTRFGSFWRSDVALDLLAG